MADVSTVRISGKMKAADRLRGPEELRVWSLIVTIFGDMVEHRGGEAAMAVLHEIAGTIGVESGALRTAASRLARDGWLERRKDGRASFYRLAPEQRAAVEAATARIYATGARGSDGRWLAVMGAAPDPAALREAGFYQLADDFFLWPPAYPTPHELVPRGASLMMGSIQPSTAHLARLGPPEIAAAYQALLDDVLALREVEVEGADAVACRLLLIHRWRRLVLRHAPDLPSDLQPAGWPGNRARHAVRELYWKLWEPSEAWLNGVGLPMASGPVRRF